ncbi:MAG: flagellar export chaperone FliS [Planctomycetes bacterium]|nr:flagellar export chaperone FliS [Planctomycetota bacterium]
MSPNPASIYFDAEAASIPRLKLVRMMYAGAIDSLERSKIRLEQKDRAGFVRSVNKAQNILAELSMALDFEQGGDIARRLDALYEWFQRSLTPACLTADVKPIDDAIVLLTRLKEGWDGIRDEEESRMSYSQ